MVDFDNETTIATNRSDILAIIILQRRYEFLNNYEKYQNSLLNNKSDTQLNFYKLKAGLLVLYYELKKTLERKEKDDKQWSTQSLLTQINNSSNIEEVMNTYDIINTVLDEIGITKIDYKKQQDYSRIIHTNRARSQ